MDNTLEQVLEIENKVQTNFRKVLGLWLSNKPDFADNSCGLQFDVWDSISEPFLLNDKEEGCGNFEANEYKFSDEVIEAYVKHFDLKIEKGYNSSNSFRNRVASAKTRILLQPMVKNQLAILMQSLLK